MTAAPAEAVETLERRDEVLGEHALPSEEGLPGDGRSVTGDISAASGSLRTSAGE